MTSLRRNGIHQGIWNQARRQGWQGNYPAWCRVGRVDEVRCICVLFGLMMLIKRDSMENFITGYPATEYQIRNALAEVIGPKKSEFFFDKVRSSRVAMEPSIHLDESSFSNTFSLRMMRSSSNSLVSTAYGLPSTIVISKVLPAQFSQLLQIH